MREWECPDAVLLRGLEGITTGAGDGEGGDTDNSAEISGGGEPTNSMGDWAGSWGNDDGTGGLALVSGCDSTSCNTASAGVGLASTSRAPFAVERRRPLSNVAPANELRRDGPEVVLRCDPTGGT